GTRPFGGDARLFFAYTPSDERTATQPRDHHIWKQLGDLEADLRLREQRLLALAIAGDSGDLCAQQMSHRRAPRNPGLLVEDACRTFDHIEIAPAFARLHGQREREAGP